MFYNIDDDRTATRVKITTNLTTPINVHSATVQRHVRKFSSQGHKNLDRFIKQENIFATYNQRMYDPWLQPKYWRQAILFLKHLAIYSI